MQPTVFTYDPQDFGWARYWCRGCEDWCSVFKRNFRNPQRGLCDDCEDCEPLPVEDVEQ